MANPDVLARADAELMRRLNRIRELEGENTYLRERVDALTQMLADADEKREWWREQYRILADRVRIEAGV